MGVMTIVMRMAMEVASWVELPISPRQLKVSSVHYGTVSTIIGTDFDDKVVTLKPVTVNVYL